MVKGFDRNLNYFAEWTYLTDSYEDAISRTSKYSGAVIYHCNDGFSMYKDRECTCYINHGTTEIVFNNLPE